MVGAGIEWVLRNHKGQLQRLNVYLNCIFLAANQTVCIHRFSMTRILSMGCRSKWNSILFRCELMVTRNIALADPFPISHFSSGIDRNRTKNYKNHRRSVDSTNLSLSKMENIDGALVVELFRCRHDFHLPFSGSEQINGKFINKNALIVAMCGAGHGMLGITFYSCKS